MSDKICPCACHEVGEPWCDDCFGASHSRAPHVAIGVLIHKHGGLIEKRDSLNREIAEVANQLEAQCPGMEVRR